MPTHNNSRASSEAEILAEMKREWAERATFYSNAGKEDRERWVARAFLQTIGLVFEESDLITQPQHSKIDIQFANAKFQIKEIPDPDLRRTHEILAITRRVMAASTLAETVGPGFVYDTPPVVDGLALVIDRATKLSLERQYREEKRELDLLFYITRTRASLVQQSSAAEQALASLGWRSISALMGQRAVVLFAAPDAPVFLREARDRC
ncbi:MAG: DUF1780 domain-containing protein [Pseudomonadota bacterium]